MYIYIYYIYIYMYIYILYIYIYIYLIMRFIVCTFPIGHIGLYISYKLPKRFIFASCKYKLNIANEDCCNKPYITSTLLNK